MRFTGLDVHKAFIYANVVDEKGKTVIERKLMNTTQALDYFLESVPEGTQFLLEALACTSQCMIGLNNKVLKLKLHIL